MSKNVKLFGSTKRAECLEQASVDSLVTTALEFPKQQIKRLKRKTKL